MGILAFTASSAVADIGTFTTFGTSIVTWLITTFGSFLSFMIANPICFVGLILALVVSAVGMLRHIIGG